VNEPEKEPLMDLQRMVKFVDDKLGEAQRGVIHLFGTEFLLFGNDWCFSRAKDEVAYVRLCLSARKGCQADELGFAADEDKYGHSWVLHVRLRRARSAVGRKRFCKRMTRELWHGFYDRSFPPLSPPVDISKNSFFDYVLVQLAEEIIERNSMQLSLLTMLD
jgi:hypothetical protein